MSKAPRYTLAWFSSSKTYELYETRDRGVLTIVLGSTEWFACLEQVSSFAFAGKSGHYTARKEATQRGGRYWYAYLAKVERLTKKYLGKSVGLRLAQLEHAAESAVYRPGDNGYPGFVVIFEIGEDLLQLAVRGGVQGIH
jgi:hypothetical protein